MKRAKKRSRKFYIIRYSQHLCERYKKISLISNLAELFKLYVDTSSYTCIFISQQIYDRTLRLAIKNETLSDLTYISDNGFSRICRKVVAKRQLIFFHATYLFARGLWKLENSTCNAREAKSTDVGRHRRSQRNVALVT